MSPLGVACLPLLMLTVVSYKGALSQPLAMNNGASLGDFSRYADRWTLSRSGCTCQFDFTRQDCACCIVGGAQCPLGTHNLCVKCGQEYTCGIPHPVIKDRVVNGWTGAMECPCPDNPAKETCACCINGGCPCANDPYLCTECGTSAGCGDGKNSPVGPPYVLNKDLGRSREGYGIHVQRDPALPNPVPLGVGSGRIPDSQMSASSYIDDHMGPHRARLNALPSDAGAGGWSPLELNRDQYLQIYLAPGNPSTITGLATQGRAGNSDEWVTSFNLAHSTDGNNWNFYGGDREGGKNGRGMMFKGNSNCDEIVHHNLEEPINARYVRFLPQDYYNRISMRVELYGYQPKVPISSGGGIQNLALYKPAQQSSTFEPIFGASGAVDGKDDEGVVITKVQTQPWWYVDLQDHYQIYFVAINNPGIMLCAEPKILTNFVVRVGDNPDVDNNPPCTAIYRRKVEPGDTVQIKCQSIDGIPPVGRYVSIELNPDKPKELTHLQVSEVKVYGVATPVPGPTCRVKEGVHYLGMQSGEINGAQITASKYLKGYQPQNGRLNLPNRAWVAECCLHTSSLAKKREYYLKIDLLAVTDLDGLLTQGSLVPEESYVSQFMMETSVDGELFVPYKEADGTTKLFQSNMDGTDIVCHLLPSQICVRAIKIIPVTWHHCVAMRVELLGYRVQHLDTEGETEDELIDIGKPAGDEKENKSPKKGKDKGKKSPKSKGKKKPKNKGKKGSDEEEPSGDIGKPASDEKENKSPKKGKGKGRKSPKSKGKKKPKNKGKKGSDEEEPSGDIGKPASDEKENKSPKKGKDKGKKGPKSKGKKKPKKKGSNEEEPSGDIGKPAGDEKENKSPKKGKDKGRKSPKSKGKKKPKNKGKKGSDEEEPSGDKGKPAADEGVDNPPIDKDKPKILDGVIDTIQTSSFRPGFNPAKGDGSWVAAVEDKKQFLDMTFEEPVEVNNLNIAPVQTDDGEAMVIACEVQYQPEGSMEFIPVVKPDDTQLFTFDDAQKGPDGKWIIRLPFTIKTQRIRLLPRKWKGKIGMKITVQGREPEPQTFILGSFVKTIQSSSYVPGFNPTSGKGTWLAAVSDDKQFLQVSFDSPKEIRKVQMAPVRLEKGEVAMVMKFKVLYRPKTENTFTFYEFPNGKDVFNVKDARVNDKGVVTFRLRPPVTAKDLRIIPLTWQNRIGFTLNLIGRKPRSRPQKDQGKPQKDMAKPERAPRRLSPRRLSFTASSVYKDYNPTTTSTNLWVPKPGDTDPYLMVTFDSEVILTSIQARGKNIPKLGGEGWIKEFRLQFGNEEQSWGYYTLEDGTNILAFDPVVDRAYKTTSFNFPEDTNVSKLKFYPVSWEKFAAVSLQLWGYYKEKKKQPKGGRRLTKYYQMWRTEASWEDAQAYCSKDNGRLAKITDPSIQEFFVKNIVKIGVEADWWIGITDNNVEGTWMHSDGTSLDYRNWIGGQKPIAGDTKNCAFLEYSEDYLWNDEDCNVKKSFICEHDKKPKGDRGPEKDLDFDVTPTYNFYSSRVTWEDAFKACKGAKGALVRIHTKEKQQFLEEFFIENDNVKGQFWIDASYHVKHKKINEWTYSNGAKLDYNNGLPTDMKLKGKQCAHFDTEKEPKFQWIAGSCQKKKSFICEIFPDKETKAVGKPARDAPSYQVTLEIKKDLKTWRKAKRSCEKWGGHLLRIPDTAFQGLIEDTLDSMPTKPEDTFWIDAHFDKKKMQYLNSNNQKVDHSKFAKGFPIGGCAYLVKSVEGWKWQDGDCNAKRQSICARTTQDNKPTKQVKPARDQTQVQLPTTFLQFCLGCMYTWQEAKEYCSKEGDGTGHLLRITDQKMFNEVVRAIKGSAADFWLDANDLMSEGKFVYSDDSPLVYANWFEVEGEEKQPDGGKAENCAYMSYSDDFEWHDGNCNDRKSFICAFTKKPRNKSPPRIPEGAVIDNEQPTVIEEPSTTPEPDINAVVTYEGSSAEPDHGPDSKTGWIAALSDRNQYVVFDFQRCVRVDELILRGVNVPGYMAWITKFGLLYKRLPDAEWTPYLQFDGTSEFDNVVTDPDERATFLFDPPILGSQIKFQPLEWKNAVAGRFTFNGRPSVAPVDISNKVNYKMSSVVRNFKPGSKYGWVARKSDKKQYLIADFRQTVELYRVDIKKVIMGQRDAWIKALKMEYSNDKKEWLPYALAPANEKGIIEVNYGDSVVARIENSVPIVARYIKIIPVEWHQAIAGKFRFFGYRNTGLNFRVLGSQSKSLPASDEAISATTSSEVEEEETGLAYNLQGFIDSYLTSNSAKGFKPGSSKGWLSPVASPNQFLTVVFQDVVKIQRLKLKGIKLENYSAWVKKFRLLYKTKESEDWTVYMYEDDKDEFEVPKGARPDRMTTFDLPSPIRAKFVKFQPVEWKKAIGAKLFFFGSRRLGKYTQVRERKTMRLYYSFHETQVSWSQAKSSCQAGGGSLARVFAPRVQEAIVDHIESIKIEGDWWIDASDASVEDQWATSVGPLPYADWLSGKKPDSNDDRDCGFLLYAENYHWDHADCEETKRYICQYETEPDKKLVRGRFAMISLFSYRLLSGKLAWVEAQAACQERGAGLVQIPDPAVQNFLKKSMKTKGKTWLDVTYNVAFPETDAWLCSAGIPMTYNNGLPVKLKGQSCAIAGDKKFSWSPEDCDKKYGYICQQQSTLQEPPAADESQNPQEVSGAKKQSFQIIRTVVGYSWRDAKKYCNDRGAHLLRIQSHKEQNRIVNFLETNKLQDEFWLDAQVLRSEGRCMTSSRQEVTFNKFQVKSGRSRRRQGCVYFSAEDGWSWKFSSCTDKKNFICQADGAERLVVPKEPQSDMVPTPQLKPVTVYYRFYRGGRYASSWEEADQFCQKAGGGSGHLARIHDLETMDYIVKMLSRGKQGRSLNGNFWFDASDVITEGKWKDGDGEDLDFTNWFSVGKKQEPNGGKAENCAFISSEHGFKWHDGACDRRLDGFICQFNARPKVKPSLPKRDFQRLTALRADLSFPKGKFTWRTGTRYCQGKYPANGGGHLLRFRDQEQEAQIVSGLFGQNKLGDFYLDVRLQPDGTWQDSNGVALPFTNWLDGDPPEDEDNSCAVLRLKKGGSYAWGTNNCKKALPLICVNYMSGPKADLEGKRIRVKGKGRSSSSGSGKGKKVKSKPASDDLSSMGIRRQKGSRSGSGKVRKGKGSRSGTGKVRKGKGSKSGTGKVRKGKGSRSGTGKVRKGKGSRSGTGKVRKGKGFTSGTGKVRKGKGSTSGTGKVRKGKGSTSGTGKVRKGKGSTSVRGKGKKIKTKLASDDLASMGIRRQKGSRSGSGKVRKGKGSSSGTGKVRKGKGSSSGSGKGKKTKSTGIRKQKGSSSGTGKVRKGKGSRSGSGKGKKIKSKPASDDLASIEVRKQKGSRSRNKKVKKVKSKASSEAAGLVRVKKQKDLSSGKGKAKTGKANHKIKTKPASDDVASTVVTKQKGSPSGKAKKGKAKKGKANKDKAKEGKVKTGKSTQQIMPTDDRKTTGAKRQKSKSSDRKQASGQGQTSYQTSYESQSSGQSQSTGSEYTYEQSSSSGHHIQQEISVSFGSLNGPQTSAVAACNGQSGMKLAVVSEKMIQDMIAEAFRNNYEGDIWIGSVSNDEKTWFDGTPVTWTWWADDKGDGKCLIMSEKDDYKWKHAPCTAEIAFFACMSRGPETVVNRK